MGKGLPRAAHPPLLQSTVSRGEAGHAPGAGLLCVPLASAAISEDTTWLLFLPLFPVKTNPVVVLGLGILVLLMTIPTLVVLGHLFFFHLYLRMCPDPHFSLCPLRSHMSQDRVRQPLLGTSPSDKSQDRKRHR